MNNIFFHPFFVHFVVALFLFSVLMDWMGLWKNSLSYRNAGWYALFATTAALIPAIASGLASKFYNHSARLNPDTLDIHLNLAVVTATGIIVLFLWRIGKRGNYPEHNKKLFFSLQIVTAVLVLVTAWYGGELVYS